LADELNSFINQGMQEWSLTGLAVAVTKDGQLTFLRGYGVRQFGKAERVDEHTVFQIGSATKPLTATAVALLVQDGQADLDTPIVNYWPSFRASEPIVSRQATLRDILCHRTGIGKNESLLYYEMPITRGDLLQRLPDVEQAAPFRTKMCYSNLMYTVAGRVVEEVGHQAWEEFMAQRLFAPLGMCRTVTSSKSLSTLENVAIPHVRVDDQTFATQFAGQDNIGPAASISSSAHDLAQWVLMITSAGRYADKQFLSPHLIGEMLKPHVLMPADPVHGEHAFNTYGLGLVIWDYHGLRIAAHSGMAGHSLAMIGFVPEKRVGVVVLTNHRRCLFHYAVFRRALDLYCGMRPMDLDAANQKLLAAHLSRQQEALQRRASERNPDKTSTLPMDSYCGRYQGPYGLIATLELDAGRIVLRFGNHVADVTHWHDDTFRARLRQRRLAEEQDWWLSFTVADRAVAKMHIQSEHDVHGEFKPMKAD
jgi:CubicO group peptidase (beta-lactamase class C family)